jgi:hypothetical protein
MRPDDILDLLKRQPFFPFRLHLSNGQTYDIRHPEMALVTRAAIVIAIPGTDASANYPDRFAIVAPIHINNIEPLSVGAPSSSTSAGH